MASAAVAIGSSLIGGYFQNKASKDATKAQTSAANQSIAAQQAALAQMRGDLMPYNQGGLGALANLTGNNYEASPGYQYLKDEMVSGIDASAAARGQLYSGGHSLDLARHVNGLAAQDYNNWWNRNMGLAQLGQNSAAGAGMAGMGAANQIGSAYGNMGQAQANGAIAQGNNWANTISNVGTGLGSILGGASAPAYGGGATASSYGLPAPVTPYANTGYSNGNTGFGGYF